MLKACSISFRPTVWKYVEARDGIDFNEVDLWEIAAVTLPACPGAILLGPAKSMEQRAAELRKMAADDLAYVAKAKASEKAAAYIASTTFSDACESAALRCTAFALGNCHAPQDKRREWRRRKGLPSLLNKIVEETEIEAPRHDPWAPKRHPSFLGRMRVRKKQAIVFLGGRIAP